MRKKIIVLIIALALALGANLAFGVLGSGQDDGQGGDNGSGNQSDIFSKPEGPMPPIPTESKYLSEIDKEEFPPATAPATPPQLRWDFSQKTVYAYDYAQKVDNFLQMFGVEMTQNMAAAGLALLKSNGDHTAQFVFKNIKVKTTVSGAGDEAPKTSEAEAPPLVADGVKEDGEMDKPLEGMFKSVNDLFPLPKKPLEVGEVFEDVQTEPINAMGSQLNIEGKTTIKLTGYVVIDGRVCARLAITNELKMLEPPSNLQGDFKLIEKGKGVFYFDLEKRRFVSGNMAFIIALRAEVEPPQISSPDDPDQEFQAPEKIRFVMDSDNLITVKYNPSETGAE